MRRGYTIIELLAVISILVVISGVIVAILYSTLRGSNKTKISGEISQNGGYVLSVVTNEIHDSRSVDQLGDSQIPGDIKDCATVSPTPPPSSSESITLRRIDGSRTTFSCEDVAVAGETVHSIAQDGVPLINTALVAVEPGSCKFTCDQSVGDLYAFPIIGVTFRLVDKNSGLPEFSASQLFETSVSLNNYLP